MVVPAATAPVAFVDSSAIVALVDRDDLTHKAAVDTYKELVSDGYRLFTTNHVINETFELLHATLGPKLAKQWLDSIDISVYVTDSIDEKNARSRVLGASDGHDVRYADAVSFAVMERLGVTDAFAVDPDFLEDLD